MFPPRCTEQSLVGDMSISNYGVERNEGRKGEGEQEIWFLKDTEVMSRWPPSPLKSVVCIYWDPGHRLFKRDSLAMPFSQPQCPALAPLHRWVGLCSISKREGLQQGPRLLRPILGDLPPLPNSHVTAGLRHQSRPTGLTTAPPGPSHCPASLQGQHRALQAARCTWHAGQATRQQNRDWA